MNFIYVCLQQADEAIALLRGCTSDYALSFVKGHKASG